MAMRGLVAMAGSIAGRQDLRKIEGHANLDAEPKSPCTRICLYILGRVVVV